MVETCLALHMPLVTLLLYALCSALLLGMAILIFLRNPRSGLHRAFTLTALCLLVWVTTLFLFTRTADPANALLLGRLNFAAIPAAVYFGYQLVLSMTGSVQQSRVLRLSVGIVTTFLCFLSALTPAIDRAELLVAASGGEGELIRHVTTYGPLFPLYVVHVLGCLVASVSLAFRARKWRRLLRSERDQLLLIGSGILATGTISLVTNALLPYALGNFRFIDIGPLSSLLFLLAVAYAIVRHHLFDIRLFIRRTLVYGLLLSFVLAGYSAVLVLVTDKLAGASRDSVARFGVLVIAFSFDPIRRFLETRVDHLLFRKSSSPWQNKQQNKHPK